MFVACGIGLLVSIGPWQIASVYFDSANNAYAATVSALAQRLRAIGAADHRPLILCGDYNNRLYQAAIADDMLDHLDVLPLLAADSGAITRPPTGVSTHGSLIDNIYHSPSLGSALLSNGPCPHFVTDHHLLVGAFHAPDALPGAIPAGGPQPAQPLPTRIRWRRLCHVT
jgi:endonuclease/exonuclease/phosphatase family metal-dependent hydrolase